MDYKNWRQDVFGQPAECDPVDAELSDETYACSKDESLDHIDRVLQDPEIHQLFNKDQIGIGVNLIYSNACSDLPFSYLEASNEQRRITGIANLVHLYQNYFARHCSPVVGSIGNDQNDGKIGFICYMLWDVFILYPGNASTGMIESSLDVMQSAINMKNENCIVSAIHGLGHWVTDAPRATGILQAWLKHPSTSSQQIIEYATQATTGCIL